jgi:hypothetical protein
MLKYNEYVILCGLASVAAVSCAVMALNSAGTEVIFWAIFAINSTALALVAAVAYLQGLSYRSDNFKG